MGSLANTALATPIQVVHITDGSMTLKDMGSSWPFLSSLPHVAQGDKSSNKSNIKMGYMYHYAIITAVS